MSCFFTFFVVFGHFREGITIFSTFLDIFINFTKNTPFFEKIDYKSIGKTIRFYPKKRVLKKCDFYLVFDVFFTFFHENYGILKF